MSKPTTMTALLLFSATLGAASVQAAAPVKGRGGVCTTADPSFWRDQGLTAKLATKLQMHKPLLREKIDVKVVGGVAVLSGNMSSARQIATAVKVASQVAGVTCVQNYLRVGSRQPARPY